MSSSDPVRGNKDNSQQQRTASMTQSILSAAILITLSACQSTSHDNNLETFYIDSTLHDCQGLVARKCLRVKTDTQAPWRLFYSEIKGFSFEPGFRYVLKVKTKKIENPPADASSIAYQLIEIEQKVAH